MLSTEPGSLPVAVAVIVIDLTEPATFASQRRSRKFRLRRDDELRCQQFKFIVESNSKS